MKKIAYIFLMLFVLILMEGCKKPSPQEIAEAQERQKEHCLNHLCENDVDPDYDRKTYTLFKRGGKWFIGPKEYGFYNGNGIFYWPSKTPGKTTATDFPEKSFSASGKFNLVGVEFWIDARKGGDTYEVISQMEKENAIVERIQLTSTLEKIRHNHAGFKLFYVSTKYKTPNGLPVAANCDELLMASTCGANFAWKPGYSIKVRFPARYIEDWPEIYVNIIEVLKLVKEK